MMEEITRMSRRNLRAWEQGLAENTPDRPAVLYRHKSSGLVDWAFERTWRSNPEAQAKRELLLRTTTAEAVRLKWLAY